MRGDDITRAGFLAGAAGLAGAFLAGRAVAGDAVAAEGGKPATARSGLRYRGVDYEVADGESPATGWRAERMRADLRAIDERLHANSVMVYGTGVDRLGATAAEAAERGLHVWLQPRLGDVAEVDILDHLAETGRSAERLRRQGARVHLSVGCEFWLFVPGIVPGAHPVERAENMLAGNYDRARMQRLLAEFTARAAAVGRSVFRGKLTYGAAHDPVVDRVDWNLFDIVSLDYYAFLPTAAHHARELAEYTRWGKPLAITEFGSCTYVGAPQAGGLGWRFEDLGKLERSERVQAEHLGNMIDVFTSLNLYAAMVHQFITPDAPHRADPARDEDKAGYGIVKTIRDEPEDPASAWHWEPKEAFHTVARRFAHAANH